jgi:hypothetical protein
VQLALPFVGAKPSRSRPSRAKKRIQCRLKGMTMTQKSNNTIIKQAESKTEKKQMWLARSVAREFLKT